MPGEQMGLTNVYQFWHGNRPETIQRIEATVRKIYTPERGYNYVTLTTDDLPDFMQIMVGRNRIEHVSDLYRYYLLYKYGGVWLDSDIAFRRFIDFASLLSDDTVVTTNVRYPRYIEASTGVLASKKGNPIIRQMFDMANTILTNRKIYGNYIAIGPALASSILSRNRDNWYCLPSHGFYHQLVDWSDYLSEKIIGLVEKPDEYNYIHADWYYAHFGGYNVWKWREIGFDRLTVIEQTMRLIEAENETD